MTAYCPFCGTANRAGSVYCNQCGRNLDARAQRACVECGAALIQGARFCQRCGATAEETGVGGEGPDDGGQSQAILALDEDEGPLESDAPALTLAETDLALVESRLGMAGSGEALAPSSGAEDLLSQLEAALPHGALSPAPGAPRQPATVSQAEGSALGAGTPGAMMAAVLASAPDWPKARSEADPRTAPPSRLVNLLLYACILAAVLLPFLLPGEWSGSTIVLSPSTAGFFDNIAALGPGAAVLVAFEYDPATQGELDPQARAVLAHLMRRGARITALSLTPQGPALAESLLAEAASGQGYRYGDDYINLGYLSGEEAALAAMGSSLTQAIPVDWQEKRPIAGRGALGGVSSLRDYEAVVVFAGDEGAAAQWLTQVGGRYGIKLLAGVSAVAVARLQPFLQSGQLLGMLGGLPGAAEYELLLNQPGRAVQMLDAQSLAHGVLVVFLLLGNLGFLVSRMAGRRAGARP